MENVRADSSMMPAGVDSRDLVCTGKMRRLGASGNMMAFPGQFVSRTTLPRGKVQKLRPNPVSAMQHPHLVC